MLTLRPDIYCGSCGECRPLGQFRLLSPSPLLYLDFCGVCEDGIGLRKLYGDEKYAKWVNPKVVEALKRDPAKKKKQEIMLAGVEEAKQAVPETFPAETIDERRRELARRELMRRRFIYYVTQNRPDYRAGWVHKDIARRLEQFMLDIEAGLSPRLMIFMPPRHGKSTLTTDEFPSWLLGHHPNWEVITASFTIDLPIGFSRGIRDRLKTPDYQAMFPGTKMRADSQGVEQWHTTGGGRFRAAGVGVGITGTGAHCLIIDDPIKDYEAAQSEVTRATAYNWYTTTAKSRLAPGGGVLVIQTRWHDADLAGALLTDEQALRDADTPEDEYDHWQVVCYPALAEADEYLMPNGQVKSDPPELPEGSKLLRAKGEALHPERYNQNALVRIKNGMPPVQWNALYQQNPVPDSGEYFSNDMFRFYQDLPGTPEEFTFFMAWDLAIGEKTQNDYTVGTVGAMHINGDLYVVDMIRARMNTFQIIEAILTMAKKWPNLQVVGIEDGQIKKTMAPLLKQAMQTAKSSFSLDETLKPVTDKLMRARPLQSRMQMGQLFIPAGQPWANILQHELLRFPNGVHDDIVDSLAWLARMGLYLKGPVMRTGEARRKKQKSWKDDLKMHVAGSSGGRSFMTA